MAEDALTVAVTGPTGEIGRSLLRSLEGDPRVARVVAMGRRPFEPGEAGLSKTEYRRGDVLDRVAVDELVAGAEVVVHLASLIMGSREETERTNLEGSQTVFEAAVAARCARLVYGSSVAAYGFHADTPRLLKEDMAPAGTENHYYSAHKAGLEAALQDAVAGSSTAAYIFRPCIVAGPDALALVRNIPYVQLFELVRRHQNPLTAAVIEAATRMPSLRPILPDPGTPFQLVHHDDVASAFTAAVRGGGAPGIYNLAAPDEVTISQLARELGWYSFPVPHSALDSAAELIARLPVAPAQAQWIESFRQPVLMDTAKARRELAWQPRHDALDTLRSMAAAARRAGLLELG